MTDSNEVSLKDATFHDAIPHLLNLGWQGQERHLPCDRMPKAAEADVTEAVWRLSRSTAGITVEFDSNSSHIFLRWRLENPVSQWEPLLSTQLRMGGFDFYGLDDTGCWRWAGFGTPWQMPAADCKLNKQPLDGTLRRWRIYLPLEIGVSELAIGVAPNATFSFAPVDSRKPIAYYGTSIVHGVAVSRPGMTHAAQLGRIMDWPVINLGFRGSAKMEEGIGRWLAKLDPHFFLLDAMPNMNAELVAQRLDPFLDILRASHPELTVVMLNDRIFGDHAFSPDRRSTWEEKNRIQREIFERRRESDPNLHLLASPDWYGEDATIDANHPNDLGAYRMAQQLARGLRQFC